MVQVRKNLNWAVSTATLAGGAYDLEVSGTGYGSIGLVSDLRSILRRRLDRNMTTFKRKNPEFYAGYLVARVIVDRGGGGGATPSAPTPAPVTPK